MTISEAFQMALQRHQAGRFAEAEALYRQILTVQPEHADALHLLGVAAHQTGRHDLAVGWIRQAIALNPKHSTAYSNLGEVCRALGRMDEAIDAYRRAIELKPDHTEAHNNLGVALKAAGRMDEAIAAYRRTLELRPDYPEAHNNLGNALAGQGKIEEAIAMYRRALELKPDYAEACNNLGTELAGQRKLGEAIAVYQRALKLRPDYPEAHNNLGVALKDLGELDEAMAACRRSLELKPDQSWTHSNLIYMLHFHPGHDDGTISEERDRWNRRFGGGFKRLVQTQANDPAVAGRRLRIGYVSPDFREHPVGRHMLPLFQNHDDRDFEILCYSGVTRSDRLTEELRQLAREWRSTVGVGDEALAEMIRRDGVDILVDLTQHMAENRLPVFARQPAPVQVSFAGYPDGTGLEAIEYRISDRYLEADRVDGEMGPREQVRLIDSFWCYDPCGMEVEVNPLPALESGLVTFGCLGNFCKVNDSVLRLWARALGKVRDSRLIISSPAGSHRERTLETLGKEGVAARRVEFVDLHPRREYLELYHRLDIVLDTFPYNGHTTSLDALWMGVPVVSLAGKTSVSRGGLSLLTNLGLPELTARSEPDYVSIAESMAGDIPRLAKLRSTLRHRLESSVVMDAPRFARQMEAAYRSMWECWCDKTKDEG